MAERSVDNPEIFLLGRRLNYAQLGQNIGWLSRLVTDKRVPVSKVRGGQGYRASIEASASLADYYPTRVVYRPWAKLVASVAIVGTIGTGVVTTISAINRNPSLTPEEANKIYLGSAVDQTPAEHIAVQYIQGYWVSNPNDGSLKDGSSGPYDAYGHEADEFVGRDCLRGFVSLDERNAASSNNRPVSIPVEAINASGRDWKVTAQDGRTSVNFRIGGEAEGFVVSPLTGVDRTTLLGNGCKDVPPAAIG